MRPEAAGPIRLEAEGRVCLIEAAGRDPAARLNKFVQARTSGRDPRGLLLLDRAFGDEAPAWAEAWPGFRVTVPEGQGEAVKTLEAAGLILAELAAEKLARDDWLIVRGGGALTDLGGFCAGLYRRGLRLILVPTTLLGAVDAAVGGKTAVNFLGAKNQIGHFYLPELVLADLAAFKTLPPERLAEGLVEAYKTGLLFDPDLAALAVSAEAEKNLAEIVRRSAAAKAALAARDFREEQGLRDVLNLGHTYGHVLESYHGLSHGRAVAGGLAVAADLSRRLAGLNEAGAADIIASAERLAGPWPEPVPEEAARELLRADKKIRGGRIKFVALAAPGRPKLIEAEAEDILESARLVLKVK